MHLMCKKVIYCLLVVMHALDLSHVLLTQFVLVLRQVCVQVPTLTLVRYRTADLRLKVPP